MYLPTKPMASSREQQDGEPDPYGQRYDRAVRLAAVTHEEREAEPETDENAGHDDEKE